MNEFLVSIVTAIPVAIFGAIGYRVGGRRVFTRAAAAILASALGVLVAAYGFQHSWFEPVGLVTPVLLGVLAMFIGWRGLRRLVFRFVPKPKSPARPSRSNRIVGAVLGACVGFRTAVALWVVSPLATEPTRPVPRNALVSRPAEVDAEPSSESVFGSLVRTANRGFIRHLPVVGPIGDEMEAVNYILNTPIEVRRQLAEGKAWEQMAKLPSYQAIMENDAIFDEIDAVGENDIAALYRLQKNPLVIAFFKEGAVQDVLSGVRATTLAADLEQLQRSGGTDTSESRNTQP